MNTDVMIGVAAAGFIAGALGGLGNQLLANYAGRNLEAYCRLRHRRDRFGAILDHQYDAMRAAEYLRIIGNSVFLGLGTLALAYRSSEVVSGVTIVAWVFTASISVMLTHLWLPSAITRFVSSPLLYHSWPFWRVLAIVAAPLAAPGALLEMLTRRLAGQSDEEEDEEEILHDEIRKKVAEGSREGYLGKGVREMIQGVLDLHDDTVGHIMTPRGDVDAIPLGMPWDEVMRFVVEAGRTRLPVYDGTLDRVVGILYVKDLLAEVTAGGLPKVELEALLRKPWCVPIDRSVESLLREFLHSRSHMAIVLDEFHQTVGVVTIEDALEEIVGEIVDESDEDEEIDLRWIDDVTAEADGRVMIDQINERLGWDLPESEDYETIAGFVLHHLGALPQDGQQITIGNTTVEILKASNRQIERLRLKRQAGRLRESSVQSLEAS